MQKTIGSKTDAPKRVSVDINMLILFNPIITTLGMYSNNVSGKNPYTMKILTELSLENNNKEMKTT